MNKHVKVLAIVALILGSLYGACWYSTGQRAAETLRVACEAGNVEACKPL